MKKLIKLDILKNRSQKLIKRSSKEPEKILLTKKFK